MSIGGVLDYELLAQLHRPRDPAALRSEVHRLATSQGLTAADIATALRLNLAQVREMLAASPSEAALACAEVWNAH